MEDQSFGGRVKRTSKKILRIFIIVVVVAFIASFSYLYWGTLEEGVMAGKILRVSEKGIAFKTYEGKINLETFGALRGASPIAESFDFSIEKSNPTLYKELEQVALTGERVNLHFTKRPLGFPWRGDTRYFATSIERLGPASK
ncbi:MAG: hypothetical protein ABIS36_24875 [Chryseolinea sp.]